MIDIEVKVSKAVRTVGGRVGRSVVRDLAATILKAAHTTASVLSSVVDSHFSAGSRELARSFVAHVGFVAQQDDEVSARTFSPLPYARIQDSGGTIKPRTAKALAIPMSATARTMWPRDWPEEQLRLIVLRGKAFLVERVGKGKLIFHYVLKPEVKITGKGYVEEARKKALPQVDQMMRQAVARLLAEGGDA